MWNNNNNNNIMWKIKFVISLYHVHINKKFKIEKN